MRPSLRIALGRGVSPDLLDLDLELGEELVGSLVHLPSFGSRPVRQLLALLEEAEQRVDEDGLEDGDEQAEQRDLSQK